MGIAFALRMLLGILIHASILTLDHGNSVEI